MASSSGSTPTSCGPATTARPGAGRARRLPAVAAATAPTAPASAVARATPRYSGEVSAPNAAWAPATTTSGTATARARSRGPAADQPARSRRQGRNAVRRSSGSSTSARTVRPSSPRASQREAGSPANRSSPVSAAANS
ncbi:hypothetical protein [Jannaschia sp. R86511]|uniref:hypothetical protein n=1 Tax=Jannaschia sp. R86511 TaxID=3093853 RepID=UPI0036D249E7